VKNSLILCLIFLFLNTFSYSQTGANCEEITNKKAIRCYQEAEACFKKKQYDLAIKSCKQAIEAEPEYVDAKYMIAEINIKRENINIAKKYLKEVFDLCPKYNVYVYYYLGEIAVGDEDWKKAYEYLKEFLKDVDKIKSDDDYKRASEDFNKIKFYNDGLNNKVSFNPLPVMNLSTKADEYLGSLTFDNETMYFTRKDIVPKAKGALTESDDRKYQEKFMFAKHLPDGTFTKGEEMPAPFNQSENTGSPSLTIDNKELFCTVCKNKFNTQKKKNYYNCDIYTSQFKDDYWTDLTPLPSKINLPDTWESQPCITSDGLTLFFVSDRPGGIGGTDIYKVNRNEKGVWDTIPENLGPLINTSGREITPFMHTDRQTLYFSSADWTDKSTQTTYPGHKGYGGYDIFYSKLNENNKWSPPRNIGFPINSEQNDLGFFVSTDGKTAFFSADTSRRLKGVGGIDLFSFELYKEARPERVTLLKGNINEEENQQPSGVKIELQDVKTKKITKIPVDSTTGKYIAAVVMKDDYVMTVKKQDYAYSYKYIHAPKDSDTVSVAHVDFEIKKIEVGKPYKINDIYFGQNSFELQEESKFVLDQFVVFLNENPSYAVTIQGHTDNLWSDEYNLKLSITRAKAVQDYLIQQGINASRLKYEGFGKSRPVATNDTPEGRAKNRRTEFVIIRK